MTLSDLSPDALAKLEAKLLADVEVVRRMRVLMEEHQGLLRGSASGPAVSAPAVAASGAAASGGTRSAPVTPEVPAVPRKSFEGRGWECVQGMPETGFVMDDL